MPDILAKSADCGLKCLSPVDNGIPIYFSMANWLMKITCVMSFILHQCF